jgi:hypothetical protein
VWELWNIRALIGSLRNIFLVSILYVDILLLGIRTVQYLVTFVLVIAFYPGEDLEQVPGCVSSRNAAMPSKLSKHPAPPAPPSFLSAVQPETIPWTDELEFRLEALKKMKSKHSERAKYAVENLRASIEEISRIRERERGKAKAVEKVKRERDCAWISLELYSQCLLAYITCLG